MILRNFLFLDTQSLNDYLAALEGYVPSGEGEQTVSGTQRVEADASLENTTERRQGLVINDAAKFQQLYKILDKEGEVEYIEKTTTETFTSLKRNQIIEIQAIIELPKPFLMSKDIESVSPLLEIVRLAGQTIDPQAEIAVSGLQGISRITADQPIPIIGRTITGMRLPFVTNLPRQYIRCQPQELQGEAVIFAKVQRLIPQKQSYEVFSLVPLLTNSMMLNRSQKKKAAKDGVEKGFVTELRGPAVILTPVAVYR